ncbi:MAG: hypothetical protein A3J38_06400 [Gammaproteobacteria bacterium RIFCSPHIGHO2_12_FULL_45_9]|nr:MAG: hypothetical protein A3J38_06400 [Gammaproteobacteria bacterium RIFCSPHIGHO2_12_FULL_45_9]
MNRNFISIIAAPPDDRRDLFLATANRLGTTLQNIEKDFWVCWVIDLLFNGRNPNEPRLLFKGGTSLSKAYGLISRFSEDIDITVFREDLGHDLTETNLIGLSRKQQSKQLDAIKKTCQAYIQHQLKLRLSQQIQDTFDEVGIFFQDPVVLDADDPDQQTLLMHYPSVISGQYYVRPSVKIEAGAKSALDPHQKIAINPYLSEDIMPSTDFLVRDVITIKAERTFWDKIIILHGLRAWFDNRGELRQQGHRISRHYYDVFKLLQADIGKLAQVNDALALDCAHHAQLFFNRVGMDLEKARPGSFKLAPAVGMADTLKRDYQSMSSMIFGHTPDFENIIQAIHEFEERINTGSLSRT